MIKKDRKRLRIAHGNNVLERESLEGWIIIVNAQLLWASMVSYIIPLQCIT